MDQSIEIESMIENPTALICIKEITNTKKCADNGVLKDDDSKLIKTRRIN